jgi:hypothetical protein
VGAGRLAGLLHPHQVGPHFFQRNAQMGKVFHDVLSWRMADVGSMVCYYCFVKLNIKMQ